MMNERDGREGQTGGKQQGAREEGSGLSRGASWRNGVDHLGDEGDLEQGTHLPYRLVVLGDMNSGDLFETEGVNCAEVRQVLEEPCLCRAFLRVVVADLEGLDRVSPSRKLWRSGQHRRRGREEAEIREVG